MPKQAVLLDESDIRDLILDKYPDASSVEFRSHRHSFPTEVEKLEAVITIQPIDIVTESKASKGRS